ncbi:MAG TPA: S8 family serine peptidase [Candidatus Polarisedimenticolia bacterium]|nr:S8 family serine peptidase [Candidatus Polarisedimenticolia bacterium]
MNPAVRLVLRPARRYGALAATLFILFQSIPIAHAGTNVVPLVTDPRQDYVPDEILVKFKDITPAAGALRRAGTKGAMAPRLLTPDGLVRVKLPAGISPRDAIAEWSASPDVEYATLNACATAFLIPNDPAFRMADVAWSLRNVGAYEAWDLVPTADSRIVLASIDTGVAYETHPIPDYERARLDSRTKQYMRSPELPGPFLPGYDFVNDDDHPDDDNGHGTRTMTVAAGQPNNRLGSAGIAFGVTILPIKVLGHDENGTMDAIVQGIRYAADQGADIANISLGFQPIGRLLEKGFTPEEIRVMFRPLRDAVHYALSRGVVLVAATGNFAYPEISLPAGYPGVISVGATGTDNLATFYSDWGKELTCVAPGGDFGDVNQDHIPDGIAIYAQKRYYHPGNLAKPDSFQLFFDNEGTSFAAPYVSGAVALLMTAGVKNRGSIEEILRSTAFLPVTATSRDSLLYGSGVLQVDKALKRALGRGGPRLTLGRGGTSGGTGLRVLSENPSRGGASLSLRTATPGLVTVQLFDVTGRRVRTLEQGRFPGGQRTLRWDGKDDHGESVGSGVYFFRITTPDGVEQRKVAVLR